MVPATKSILYTLDPNANSFPGLEGMISTTATSIGEPFNGSGLKLGPATRLTKAPSTIPKTSEPKTISALPSSSMSTTYGVTALICAGSVVMY